MPNITRIEQTVRCGRVMPKRVYDYTKTSYRRFGATSQEIRDFSRYLITRFKNIYRSMQNN